MFPCTNSQTPAYSRQPRVSYDGFHAPNQVANTDLTMYSLFENTGEFNFSCPPHSPLSRRSHAGPSLPFVLPLSHPRMEDLPTVTLLSAVAGVSTPRAAARRESPMHELRQFGPEPPPWFKKVSSLSRPRQPSSGSDQSAADHGMVRPWYTSHQDPSSEHARVHGDGLHAPSSEHAHVHGDGLHAPSSEHAHVHGDGLHAPSSEHAHVHGYHLHLPHHGNAVGAAATAYSGVASHSRHLNSNAVIGALVDAVEHYRARYDEANAALAAAQAALALERKARTTSVRISAAEDVRQQAMQCSIYPQSPLGMATPQAACGRERASLSSSLMDTCSSQPASIPVASTQTCSSQPACIPASSDAGCASFNCMDKPALSPQCVLHSEPSEKSDSIRNEEERSASPLARSPPAAAPPVSLAEAMKRPAIGLRSLSITHSEHSTPKDVLKALATFTAGSS